MSPRPSPWVSVLYGGGLLAVFLGERVAEAGAERLWVGGGGGVLMGLAGGWRATRVARTAGDGRRLELALGGLFGVGALGVFLALAGGGAVLPGALLAVALFPLVLGELAVASLARAPVLELGRVHAAFRSGLGLAFTLLFAASAQSVATREDVSWDLASFRTTRPGEASRRLVRQLEEPVEVTLFFPPANDVRQALEDYFQELARESGRLRVEGVDLAVERSRAKALGVRENGWDGSVVFSRGGHHERLQVPLEWERARSQLRRLDEDVYRRLRGVSRPRRVLYLTAGHGERGVRPRAATALEPERPGLSQLEEWLRVLNVEVRTLGAPEGLGTDVPGDAALVAVVGPEREFSAPEFAALRRYVARGGRVWLALEPEGPGLEALLAPWGLRLSRVPLASEPNSPRADRALLSTTRFSAHASVLTLASLGGDAPVLFSGATALESMSPLPRGVSQHVTVRAPAETFADSHPDVTPGKDAVRGAWPLVVAVEQAEAPGLAATRAVVMGDADVMTDASPRGYGNPYLLVDTVFWLLGEEELAGEVSNEDDMPVQHTRRRDVGWFYSAVFLAPAGVLGVGFAVTRRRRRAVRTSAEAGR